MTADFKATDGSVNPRGYTVPDFGVDPEVIDTSNSIKVSEA